jgi:hypothetical protein
MKNMTTASRAHASRFLDKNWQFQLKNLWAPPRRALTVRQPFTATLSPMSIFCAMPAAATCSWAPPSLLVDAEHTAHLSDQAGKHGGYDRDVALLCPDGRILECGDMSPLFYEGIPPTRDRFQKRGHVRALQTFQKSDHKQGRA